MLAWRTHWTEEAGGLESVGFQRFLLKAKVKRPSTNVPSAGKADPADDQSGDLFSLG